MGHWRAVAFCSSFACYVAAYNIIPSLNSLTRRSILTSPLLLSSQAASAVSASLDYDRFSKTYDDLDGGKVAGLLGLDKLRATVVGKAHGRVLEVGVGTGT